MASCNANTSPKIHIKDVVDLYESQGKNKCIDFLMKTNTICSIQPSVKAYEKSIDKLIKVVKSLKKSMNRVDGSLKYECFINKSYVFPVCNLKLCEPKLTTDDTLDLQIALKDEKKKTNNLMNTIQTIKVKLQKVEEEKSIADKKLKIVSHTLSKNRLKLKRIAAREAYALNKIKKLEDNVAEHCCNENLLKIKVLENQLIEKDKEIRQLKSNNEYLQDLINEKLKTQQEIQLFDEEKNMFLNNKTLAWLEHKPQEERQALIKEATKNVKIIKQAYKTRLMEIENNRRLAIQEKSKKQEALRVEKLRKQVKQTQSIITHGLWQSENEIDNMVNSYQTKTEQMEALKVQLKFRKNVLQQVSDDKTCLNFTKCQEGKKARKNLSIDELKVNLKTLIRQAVVKDLESNQKQHLLVGKRVCHRFHEDTGDKWYTGKIISQVPAFAEWFNIVDDGGAFI